MTSKWQWVECPECEAAAYPHHTMGSCGKDIDAVYECMNCMLQFDVTITKDMPPRITPCFDGDTLMWGDPQLVAKLPGDING